MDEKTIQACGVEMAENWLRSAIESGTVGQQKNQIDVLESASLACLGNLIANQVKQDSITLDQAMNRIQKSIKGTAELILKAIETGEIKATRLLDREIF